MDDDEDHEYNDGKYFLLRKRYVQYVECNKFKLSYCQ